MLCYDLISFLFFFVCYIKIIFKLNTLLGCQLFCLYAFFLIYLRAIFGFISLALIIIMLLLIRYIFDGLLLDGSFKRGQTGLCADIADARLDWRLLFLLVLGLRWSLCDKWKLELVLLLRDLHFRFTSPFLWWESFTGLPFTQRKLRVALKFFFHLSFAFYYGTSWRVIRYLLHVLGELVSLRLFKVLMIRGVLLCTLSINCVFNLLISLWASFILVMYKMFMWLGLIVDSVFNGVNLLNQNLQIPTEKWI
jgi:hypothetical protein